MQQAAHAIPHSWVYTAQSRESEQRSAEQAFTMRLQISAVFGTTLPEKIGVYACSMQDPSSLTAMSISPKSKRIVTVRRGQQPGTWARRHLGRGAAQAEHGCQQRGGGEARARPHLAGRRA
jgi:hypothetical protein